MMFRRFAASALAAGVSLGLAGAADWPRLRGPNGTGVAEETTPVAFTEKNRLWKAPIPGVGHGSPIVVGEHVFVQSSSVDLSERTLICLNAATGKAEWTKGVGAKKPDSVHKKNTAASSTPASDGERVFASVWDGSELALYGYDLAGRELWKTPLGTYWSAHGAAHSPMAFDGLVYLNVDSDSSARLVALDAKTGVEKWKADRVKERASYTTPIVLEAKGKPAQLILGTTTAVDSYDPQTGKSNWTHAVAWGGTKLRAVGQPILAAGNVVTYMGEGGKGRYMIAVKTDGSGELGAAGKVWDSKEASKTPYVPSALAHGDHLYWVNDTGFACCADAKTGKILWYERAFSGGVSSSPILVKDAILAFDEAGQSVAFKATPTGFEKVGASDLGEAVLSSPAAAGGRLFVRGAKNLYCFGAKGS